MSEYQKAQIDIETKKLAKDGDISPEALAKINTERETQGLSKLDSN